MISIINTKKIFIIKYFSSFRTIFLSYTIDMWHDTFSGRNLGRNAKKIEKRWIKYLKSRSQVSMLVLNLIKI